MLVEIADAYGRDSNVRAALLDAMKQINSNSTLASLLTDLEERGVLTADESLEIAFRQINSNSTLAGLLEDRMQDGLIGAEETLDLGARYINSDSTYAELLYEVAVVHRDDSELATLLRPLYPRNLLPQHPGQTARID